MTVLKTTLRAFYSDESGAAAIEYGLLLALLALALVGAITTLGESTSGSFESFTEALDEAQASQET